MLGKDEILIIHHQLIEPYEKINIVFPFLFDDVDFPLTQYYLQGTNHSNYLQFLSITKELKDI